MCVCVCVCVYACTQTRVYPPPYASRRPAKPLRKCPRGSPLSNTTPPWATTSVPTICILPPSWIIQATIRPLFTPLLLAQEVQLALKQNSFRLHPPRTPSFPEKNVTGRRKVELQILVQQKAILKTVFGTYCTLKSNYGNEDKRQGRETEGTKGGLGVG